MTTTISGTGPIQTVLPATTQETSARPSTASKTDNDAAATAASDTVTIGARVDSGDVYTDPRKKALTSPEDMQAILEESDRQAQAVMNLILPLVQQQGLNLAKVVSGEQKLNVDQASIDKAQAAIADDGEFGVKQVAKRILDFVQSVSGGDPEKLATMRAAVEDGFKQAADMLGGTLPDISEQTHKMIMDTFDSWQSDGAPAKT